MVVCGPGGLRPRHNQRTGATASRALVRDWRLGGGDILRRGRVGWPRGPVGAGHRRRSVPRLTTTGHVGVT
jgi:hypothetical protein